MLAVRQISERRLSPGRILPVEPSLVNLLLSARRIPSVPGIDSTLSHSGYILPMSRWRGTSKLEECYCTTEGGRRDTHERDLREAHPP